MAIETSQKLEETKKIALKPKVLKPKISQENSDSAISIQQTQIFLHKIILENFLSFKHDEIEFDPKFTIITGPNGAGKSSIYQALKFALGSNDYDGRYSKWSDFIHRGEKFARVKVFFKSGDKIYLIQRTVLQGNTPKYAIKFPGEEKLHNTNYGSIRKFKDTFRLDPDDVFAFMSQGSIDSIKDFKEETLCNFVEQGIGIDIIKHRIIHQKELIENLSKEYDSLDVKRQNLKYQLAEIAPKLIKLRERKNLEKQLEKLNVELIFAQKEQFVNEISEIDKKIEITSIQLQKITQIIQKFQKERNENENLLNGIIDVLMTKKVAISTIKEQLKQVNAQISDQAQIKEKLAQDIENLTRQIEDLGKRDKAFLVKQQVIEENLINIDNKINLNEQQISEIQTQQNHLQQKYLQDQDKILEYDKLLNSIDTQKTKLGVLEKQHQKLEEEINHRAQEIVKCNKNLEKYTWFLENPTVHLQAKMQEYFRSYSAKVEQLEYSQQQLQKEHKDLLQAIEQLKQSFIDKSLPKPKSIQKMIDEIHQRDLNCIGPLIDFIHYDDMFRLAVESIFGSRVLFSFIAKDNEAFRQLKDIAIRCRAKCNIYKSRSHNPIPQLNSLEYNTPGVFGYLVHQIKSINNDLDIHKVIATVASKTIIVKDHIEATHFIDKYRYQNWVVTLDGEQIRPKKYILEARPYIPNTNRKGIRSVAQAKQKLNEFYTQLKNNRAQFNEQIIQKKKISERIQTFKQRLSQIDKLLTIYKKKEITTRLKNKNISERQQIYTQMQNQTKTLKKMTDNLVEIKKNLPKDSLLIRSQLEEFPSQIHQIQQDIIQYRETQANIEKDKTQIKIEIAKISTQIEMFTREKENLIQTLQKKDVSYFDAFQKSMKFKEELDKLIQEKKLLDDQLKQQRQLNIEKNQEYQDIELKKATLTARNKDLEHQRNLIEEKLQLIFSRMGDSSAQKIQPREIAIINSEISDIQNRLFKYRFITDKLLHEQQKLNDQVQKIQEKRKEIKNEINAAISANNELENAYYDKFKISLEDIQESINSKLLLAGMQYSTSFKLIGNIHNLGLRITTNSKTASGNESFPLSALSGGQRSLIGICLMLSLNHTNPSHVNMYDECDMFLDERNAETVAKLIHTTAREGIQFVLLMPSKNNILLSYSKKVVGISRNGVNGPSTVHYGKAINRNQR